MDPRRAARGVRLPAGSSAAFLVLVALDVWLVFAGVGFGRRFQGDAYVVGAVALNVAWCAAIVGAYVWNRRRPGPARNLWCHAVAFAWLGFAALPYMGELP